MNLARRMGATALLLTLPLGLTACGGGKPSKEEVQAGYAKLLESNGGGQIPQAQIDSIAKCVTDKAYDNVSGDTLDKIAKGENARADNDDVSKLTGYAGQCSSDAFKTSAP
ncbi:hypothetical protein FB554_3382 [Barrientosiimonas humi]|uniref:DUF732 domain-containing protein n=2 Tax=Barrientosiimonas TaxID=1535207 RepID=A0A542WZR3_9MICO|nr:MULTISPECIES: hypothetical protein [Barrientosiimonas]TQL29065.1 hypothetical protein FB554_3382 [Barrientosiimonas humi]BDZ56533.1 hypothetical protein GCM10025872_01900 [Barrientosiimonas endolithica]CAG7571592.1 hypothetical protein BH39T_PBIAJDOK_00449 [Barrientosiimonas humi]